MSWSLNNFEVMELDNFKFSITELIEFYNTVEKNFQHLKWTPDDTIDTKDHQVKDIFSWAIQSNLKDPSKPCPPYNIKHDESIVGTFDVPTELIFGFSKKFLELFPFVRQTVISCHPPGSKINLHTDNEEFFKIHIPIVTNDDSYFVFEKNRYNLKPGKAYLVNTEKLHGTENLGNSTRIHFITKLKIKDIDRIINNEHRI